MKICLLITPAAENAHSSFGFLRFLKEKRTDRTGSATQNGCKIKREETGAGPQI